MDVKLFLLFVFLNFVNVILSTSRSLITVKCGPKVAALANAISFGFYTIIVIYMSCNLPLWLKVAVVGGVNYIGVLLVKYIETVVTPEKLWKIEATFPVVSPSTVHEIQKQFRQYSIPCNYIEVGNHVIFNCYCYTREQTDNARHVVYQMHGKIFVSESKLSY